MSRDLQVHTKAFIDGLNAMPTSWLYPLDSTYLNALGKLAHARVTNYSQLAALNWLSVPQKSLGFEGVKPLSGPPDSHFCFDFDSTALGWYFMYGHTATYRFTFMLFRLSLSATDHSAVIYSIVGGYDDGTQWRPVPQNAGPGSYRCSADQSVDFEYVSAGVSATFRASAGGSSRPHLISGSVTFPAGGGFKFTLAPTKPAVYNNPNGCVPTCWAGMGTSYWSYTNPTCTITVKKIQEAGVGWFDHQWIQGGLPSGWFPQVMYAFIAGGKTPKNIKWLWLTMQVHRDGKHTQYGGAANLNEGNLPLKVNDELSVTFNRYGNDETVYGIQSSLKILSTTAHKVRTGNGGTYDMVFPTSYRISIPGSANGVFLLTAGSKQDVVFMPSGTLNWEGPGTVADASGAVIGNGFLEASNLLPASLLQAVTLAQNFGDSNAATLPDQNPLAWGGDRLRSRSRRVGSGGASRDRRSDRESCERVRVSSFDSPSAACSTAIASFW